MRIRIRLISSVTLRMQKIFFSSYFFLITNLQAHYLHPLKHLYEKREGSDSESGPLTNGSGSGRPKIMRIRIPNTSDVGDMPDMVVETYTSIRLSCHLVRIYFFVAVICLTNISFYRTVIINSGIFQAKHLKDSMCSQFSDVFTLCQYVMDNSNNAAPPPPPHLFLRGMKSIVADPGSGAWTQDG